MTNFQKKTSWYGVFYLFIYSPQSFLMFTMLDKKSEYIIKTQQPELAWPKQMDHIANGGRPQREGVGFYGEIVPVAVAAEVVVTDARSRTFPLICKFPRCSIQ